MSLIDDALKRAQAAHDAERDRESRPWTPPPMPDPRRGARSRTRRALGLVFVAGALVAAFLVWRAPLPRKPVSRIVKAPAPAPTAGIPPITFEVEVAPPGRGVSSGPPLSRTGEEPSATPGAAARHELRPSPAVSTAARPEVRENRPRAPASEPKTYAGEMPLPGGGKIALDGIVFSDASPVAVVNGRILPVGAVVEGYTIVRILPDRVELEADGGKAFLTLR
jgi:hypothetical protein